MIPEDQINLLLELMDSYFKAGDAEYNKQVEAHKLKFPNENGNLASDLIRRTVDKHSMYVYKLMRYVKTQRRNGMNPVLSYQDITKMIQYLNEMRLSNQDKYRGIILDQIIDTLLIMQEESKTNNPYQEKLEAKKERYEELAQKNSALAEETIKRARAMASVIPLGQPILVDHYSAKADINYRNRIDSTYRKGFEAEEKSNYYATKASNVGKAGISSDDPEAIQQLERKLQQLENQRIHLRQINEYVRKGETGKLTPDDIALIKENNIVRGGNTIPDFVFSNLSGNIRRIRLRIDELRAKQKLTNKTIQGNGYTYKEDAELNRVMFIFPGVPSEDVRTLLKSNGFRWSPTNKAWMRQLNGAGQYAAKRIMEVLGISATESVSQTATVIRPATQIDTTTVGNWEKIGDHMWQRIFPHHAKLLVQESLNNGRAAYYATVTDLTNNSVYSDATPYLNPTIAAMAALERMQKLTTHHRLQESMDAAYNVIQQRGPIHNIDIESELKKRGFNQNNIMDALQNLVKQRRIMNTQNGWVIFHETPPQPQNEYRPIFRNGQGRLF